MKRILVVTTLAAVLALAGAAGGAEDTFGLAWGVGLPTGDTGDYISRVSFRGAVVEWRRFYKRNAAWGLNVGWNVFNESEEGTLSWPDLAVTGKAWKYVNAIPVYVGYFHYLETDRRRIRPFVGLNGGAAWMERRTDLGLFRREDRNWHVALAPELGVLLPYDSFLGFVALRYHVAFPAGELETQQWLELKIGIGLH